MTGTAPGIHRALQEARRRANLTQSELAEKVGCSQSAISMFERGRPDALAQEKVAEIARALGVEIRALPGETEAVAPSDVVLKYCPIDGCPTQEPYWVLDRLCYRPLLVRALASERTHCAECGELLEQRCPNAQCRAPLTPGSFCRACGTPYVTTVIAATEVTDEWVQERAGRARALRAEREAGPDGGREARPHAPAGFAGRKGRR